MAKNTEYLSGSPLFLRLLITNLEYKFNFMVKGYPIAFTLENGTHVIVNKTGPETYDFTLEPTDGPSRQFTYRDDRSKTDVDNELDFEQLDAVRTFWLKNEDVA
jgi:hypothetical protein